MNDEPRIEFAPNLAQVGDLEGGDTFVLITDPGVEDIYLKVDGPDQDAVSIKNGKVRRFAASLNVKPLRFFT